MLMAEFNWNDLGAFLAVVRDGRLTTAAKRLKVDHSTLSRRIIALETALQTRLFERHPTGYVLTTAGERLVVEAEAIETRALSIRARVSDRTLDLTGAVRIGTPEGFGTYFLAGQIGAIAQRYPALEIEINANTRAVSLSKREADIAILMSRPDEGRVHARKLTDYQLGLYAAQDLLARTGPVASLDDLADHRIIGYIDDLLPTPQHNYLQAIPGRIEPQVRASNVITQFTMALAGAGLCILPCFMADREPRLVRLLPADICITRTYWLVVHSDTREVGRVRAVSEFIAAAALQARATFMPGAAA
jgi:DNA-binding transcriptional LysR family regulator